VDTLCKEISSSDLCTKTSSYDLNDLVECYNNTLKSAVDRHAPVINKTIAKRPNVPWFTNEVKSAKSDRLRAERKWRRTKLHSDFLIFKALKNRAVMMMSCT
jgi:Zn-dependent M32 family carboxypeptidase